ncbi:16S rRNA (adenine(1518)-N(6)/adenine(1519)-N(6))-dimethyltransferase RsmA [Limnochorda pilosa]|uniref:Ribosomal RNA small subunit methyltransferase A n=1 Tax=Limnochorda pilosa TaxID=1555112 RepID=A0A0K2SRF6_LIMPI|nr:16S rRNA (adenine(1518)-N(6)/adenine(1519)-N(6))-dimethyltransferase RsmA [Limnochorda pilosa]BAS29424.1 dimethyladenosine transferase [Limnochorda pilosa]
MGDLASPARIRQLAAEYGLRPNRHLGQNFLIDGNIVRKVVAAAELRGTETVVEVGPGFGALTQELLARSGLVVAVERDPILARALRDHLGADPRLVLVKADARTVRWNELLQWAIEQRQEPGPWARGPEEPRPKLVANLPYAVTAPVLAGLLESEVPWERGVVMVQREVAERITAVPGSRTYGALSCLVAYHADARLVARVPATVFWPRPEVESAVVRLEFRPYPGMEALPRDSLFRVIRVAFGQRRKTLRQALRGRGGFWSREAVDQALERSGIDPVRRAETLDLAEYARLTRQLLGE